MTELKPCHVCGGKPRISGCGMVNGGYWCMVTHADADHSVWVSAEAETKEKAKALAVERWNTRHYPPEVEKAVERMKPKKVLLIDGKRRCPVCNEHITWLSAGDFCKDCAQALDWED